MQMCKEEMAVTRPSWDKRPSAVEEAVVPLPMPTMEDLVDQEAEVHLIIMEWVVQHLVPTNKLAVEVRQVEEEVLMFAQGEEAVEPAKMVEMEIRPMVVHLEMEEMV